ncbi:MAG TPA: hypothetical protein PK843_17095 [bacterium]|nr:hypothetical protein [bacterium]HPN36226.1 hypothetical protein [bacterium]
MESNQTATASPINMGRWISEGWNLVNQDLGFFAVLTLVFLVITIVAGSTVLGLVLLGPLQAGYFYILLQKLQGRPATIGDIGRGFDVFIPAMLMGILVGVFEAIGFMLCILPGFLVMAWYLFAPAFVMDKRMDFWQAMEASRTLIQKYLFEFVLFVLVQIIIILLGLLCCVIGVLVALPVCMAATACAYRDLVGLAPTA